MMNFKINIKKVISKTLRKTGLINFIKNEILAEQDAREYANLNKYSNSKKALKFYKSLYSGKAYEKYTSFLNQFRDEHYIYLENQKIKFIEKNAIDVLLNEIVINEDYFFKTDKPNPKILDCGSNFGLSIFYFKDLYPESEILAFEPDPRIASVLRENIDSNNWKKVDLHPFALSDKEEITRFYTTETDSMAGSLTERRKVHGDKVDYIEVECKTLSSYLTSKIDYLKMDIEGSEDKVLEEAKNLLNNVHYLFCEYHHGNGLDSDRLIKILTILENAGFDYQITKSYSYGKHTSYRPMEYVGNPYSSIIWAKNKNW